MKNPFDLADTFVVVLEDDYTISYGPYDANETSAFLTKWNDWLAQAQPWREGRWISIPLAKISL